MPRWRWGSPTTAALSGAANSPYLGSIDGRETYVLDASRGVANVLVSMAAGLGAAALGWTLTS